MIKTTSSPVYKIRSCLSLSLLFANTNKLFSHFQIITRENKSLLLFHLRDRISHPSLRSISIYSSHRFYFFVEIRGFICSILLHAHCLCPRLQSCPHFSRFYLLLIPAAARAVCSLSLSLSWFGSVVLWAPTVNATGEFQTGWLR